MNSVTRVLIVMAMRAEAEPIISGLSLSEVDAPDSMPFRWYRGSAASLQVMVAVNGEDERFGVDSIATIPAAVNTYAACQAFAPDLVITASTAGGWVRDDTEIGDVFLNSDRFVHHDRRIDLRGFDAYGIGSYPGLAVGGLAERLGCKIGTVTTSNSLDETGEDAAIIRCLGGKVKEMEAAGVAYICDLLEVPIMAVKAITDLVDSPVATSDQFFANLNLASARLRSAVVAVLLELESSALEDLA